MNIGVPKERRPYEFPVGLSPVGASLPVGAGHTCFVESGAGLGSGFEDLDYQRAGAQIVYSGEEAYGRAGIVLKVARPTMEELAWLVEGQTLIGLLHLPSARREKVETLLAKRISAVAYERIRQDDGTMPVLRPLSQIGGRMAAHIAAGLLQNNTGGKGILLGGVPGVPPAEVAIIGAGTVGSEAARTFVSMGAHVTLLDRDLRKLQAADTLFQGRVVTLVSHSFNLESRADMPLCRRHRRRGAGARRTRPHPHHLLRAEHARRGGAHRHACLPQRRLAVHPCAGEQRRGGRHRRRRSPAARPGHARRAAS